MAYKCLICTHISAAEIAPQTCDYCGSTEKQEYTEESPTLGNTELVSGTVVPVEEPVQETEETEATMDDLFPKTITRENDPNEPQPKTQQEEGLL